ncbi:hypothetical protein BDP55DRAFT_336870 [Colletotrichum godetiae]|uniref:Uncharacterized protein n=1 Tax=Colletotrichum godetiae TaxID=1209918 RepID=A0AAJ0ESL2_9PEZI|nr:uncharacterized protein BDP55DRAFT_336870 [Colletotrichum godetiae]KAK1659674.1 hypothetical protein BDP55DRAFT_336870 [Colletotrichum godetiae]
MTSQMKEKAGKSNHILSPLASLSCSQLLVSSGDVRRAGGRGIPYYMTITGCNPPLPSCAQPWMPGHEL